MKDKLYYFAHPYTVKDVNGRNNHYSEKLNFKLSAIRAGKLLESGWNVYSPITHCHPIHIANNNFIYNEEYKLWMKLDQLIIENTRFNGIILAPGWEKSSGCVAEKELFESKSLEILLYKNIMEDYNNE